MEGSECRKSCTAEDSDSVREDVAQFTSSIKDDERLLNAVVAINKAHVVMLMEQKIISHTDGVKTSREP